MQKGVLITFVTSVNYPIIANVVEQVGSLVLENPYVISTSKEKVKVKDENGNVIKDENGNDVEREEVKVSLFKFPPLAAPNVNSVMVLSSNVILSYEPSNDILQEYLRLTKPVAQQTTNQPAT
jgi:hypothetical protein